nr:copia protein [Tanacetum cinerariifolium]
MNGDEPVQTTRDKNGVKTEVPSKTAQAILKRQRKRKANSILLLAIPDEYQLSLLEVHGATGSNENANQKFLRAKPSSWNNIALIMRNTEGIDKLDIDDLYNNLKLFKVDIKGHSSSRQASSSSYTDDLIRGHFARECRAPRNQRNMNGDARNYMPPLVGLSFARLDDSVYRPTANKASASISESEPSVIKTSNISVEMPKVNSVRTSSVIIEDWIEFTKARNESVKSDKQVDKPKMVTQNSKADRKDYKVSTVEGNEVTAVKTSVGESTTSFKVQRNVDSGFPRHMTWNKALLTDYQDIDGGFVTFGGSTKCGKTTGQGPNWLFDIDTLANSMNYQPITAGNQANKNVGQQEVNGDTAMQEELLQFKIQKVWTLVDLPYGKKAIGTKWVYQNKKDKKGIVVRNKARLVAQGHKQEEDIDYDEVFAPVARVEAIRLFLAFASYMNFLVYQMDVKSAFLYGTIEEEVYVNQPLGFVDPEFLKKVYKVEKALYGLHQAPRA